MKLRYPEVELVIYEKNHEVRCPWMLSDSRSEEHGLKTGIQAVRVMSLRIFTRMAACEPEAELRFSFAPNPDWTEYYATAPEIWDYFNRVVIKWNVREYIQFNHTVSEIRWDQDAGKYAVTVERADGTTITDECNLFINACGILK